MLRAGKILTRGQRLLLIKFFALLTMVRWYNILAMMIALYLSSIFLLNPGVSKLAVVLDYRLHLNVFALCFIIMSGYIINSFYDVEKDMVNKPKETIFDRLISKQMSFNCYFLFNTIGMSMSFFIGYKVLLINFIFASVLWFYSHKLRKIPIAGELSASLLAIIPFFSISLYYFTISHNIVLYVGFIFAIDITRGIIKKMEAMKGDIIYDHGSLPILLGLKNAKIVIYGLMLSTLGIIFYLHPEIIHNYYLIGYLGVTILLIITSFILLIRASEQSHFRQVHLLYKVIVIGGILCIGLL
jgi:4-hydroxybenzoate polyprenyltransferase